MLETSQVSSCKAVVHHYVETEISGDVADLRTQIIEIEKACLSFEYSKSINQAAGTFTLQVTADINWKKELFAGDWIFVYLSSGNRYHLRMLGNIDRIAQFTTRNDDGLLETSYIVSGRDFGKVLEESYIWFNPINAVRLNLGTIIKTGSPNDLVSGILDAFMAGNLEQDVLKAQPQFNQWQIPYSVAREFGFLNFSKIPRFSDILVQDLARLSGYKAIENMATLQGNIWSLIKSHSNEVVNELFVELVEGKPTLILRSRPYTSRGFVSPTLQSELTYFEDLLDAVVEGRTIVGSDVGFSDSDRYNLFLMAANADVFGSDPLLNNLRPDFPKVQKGSILRNGLRVLYQETDFALAQYAGKNRKNNPLLLHEWNRLLHHWYNNAVFMESGSIELVEAHPYLRVGKRLTIQDSTINDMKTFYVEGYSDSWSFPGEWHQTVELSRGHRIQKGRFKLIHQTDKADKIYTGQTVLERGES